MSKTDSNYIKCGECNKYYLCTICGSHCGSEGHFIEKETLEEAAEKYKKLKLPDDLYDGFIAGAKWQSEQLFKDDAITTLEMGIALLLKNQEKMYTKEEVKILFDRFTEFMSHNDPDEWTEYIQKIINKK